MSERLTRKDMKKEDQFVSTMGATFDYGRSHLRSIVLVVAAVVGVAVLGAIVVFYLDHRKEASGDALAEAMEVYAAPLTGDTASGTTKGPSFATEEERRNRAKELFTQVEEDFGSTNAGAVASIYLAGIAAEEGNLEAAEGLWRKVADDQKSSVLGMGVRLNLITLRRSRGEGEAVAAELQGMLDAQKRPLPEDAILYELGVTLEELDRGAEAVPHFQRIVDEFPTSQYSQPAQQKLDAAGSSGSTSPSSSS
jgi:predicted negative regulator of RcsB-dependent stress response